MIQLYDRSINEELGTKLKIKFMYLKFVKLEI